MAHSITRSAAVVALFCAFLALFAPAQASPAGDKLYASAVSSFQQGRYPEAYGRFIALADSGHAPAAEVALFMALNSSTVFGRDWDVSQDQLNAWAALAGRPAPRLQALVYPSAAVALKRPSR